MAEITVLVDRFYEIRKLMLDLKYRVNRKNQVPIRDLNHLYTRQRRRRLEKQALMKSDPRFAEFFAWVFSLQKRLKVTDKQFAQLCDVTPQMIKLWRNFDRGCGGTFPSRKTFLILLRLEVVAQAKIVINESKTKVRNKKSPHSKIVIPKLKFSGRRRLSANVSY